MLPVTERIYRMSVKRGRVAGIGTPPRRPTARSDRVTWDIPEPDLADVPLLRNWLRERKVAGIRESGHVRPAEPLPVGGEPYAITGVPWTPWRGPALTRSIPCGHCRLNTSTVTPPREKIAGSQIGDVLDALAEAPTV